MQNEVYTLQAGPTVLHINRHNGSPSRVISVKARQLDHASAFGSGKGVNFFLI